MFVKLLPLADYDVPDGYSLSRWTAGYRCPSCGRAGHWRSGVHFDHEMRCFNGCDPAPVWEPDVEYILMTKK